MKVFSFYSWLGNLVNFKCIKGKHSNTIHLFRALYQIDATKCGVLFI